jgi:potassium-transporting ATPase potassium-binding subunit
MMLYGWIEFAVFLGGLALLTKPVGLYLAGILDGDGQAPFSKAFQPIERLFFRILRVDPTRDQDWRAYTASLLIFSGLGFAFTFAVLRLQKILPLNPQGLGPVEPTLAFNTAASFVSNTNWQNYAGETTLSHFSQMVGLTFQNFASAAVGIAVAAALVRGIARSTSRAIGNFWADLVRINVRLLLPISLIVAVFLLSQGVIQSFGPYTQVRPIESAAAGSPASPSIIVQGPVASQVAIKMLGTNGGGFTNANASHPFENPTPVSNFLQMFLIFLIPSGLTYYLGRRVGSRKHGWAVWVTMAILFTAAVFVSWRAESAGNPRLTALGVAAADGNMEGKEVRFGVFESSLFSVVTTDASCGAVNSMHDSFTPLGGLVTLFNIQLGECVFGGVGSGLYGILVFVVLAIFLTGLMVGRTPEYLGKKIEARDVKLCVIAVIVIVVSTLGFTALSLATRAGLAGPLNAGPHGFSEILYAFTSAVGNNGSAFAGLSGNTAWYNITLGLAMLFGRYLYIVPVLALAGSLAGKKRLAPGKGSFPAWGLTFIVVLLGTIIIVGALTFFPALALGPVVEHALMTGSQVLY